MKTQVEGIKNYPSLIQLLQDYDTQDSLLHNYIDGMRTVIGNTTIMRVQGVADEEVLNDIIDQLANILGWMQNLNEEVAIGEL